MEKSNNFLDRHELELEALYEKATPSEAEIKKGLRIRTLSNEIVPILCGSAFKNKGVQAVLDAVVDFLPSPADVPPVEGEDDRGNKGILA